MRATYKYKVYDSKRNQKFDRLLSIASWVYNHCIALHKRYYRLFGKSLNANKLKVHLTKLKKQSKYKDWNLLSSQSIQQIAEKIDLGYKRFFKRQSKRPPTFRKRSKYQSITFKSTGWSLNGNILTINSIKLRLKFFKSRDIQGTIKTVTVKKDAVGDLWICFFLDNVENQTEQFKSGKTAGFDFGMKTFLTISDETTIESPLYLFHTLDNLRRKSRNLSKKQRGSNSCKKARVELSKLHRKISNQREDFQWKTALEIVRKYDTLCFEDLNMKGMQMIWGRKITDLSFASFLYKVEYLAQKYGKKVVKIGRFEPSSKACFDCGYIYKELQLKERIWHCPNCGKTHDRDLNAAKNILKVGTSTLGVETVRPS